ncbi:MAG: DNA repair protein RecN [Pseudomonadota bacterium]
MLRSLSARNFILIDQLDLEFTSGFHVITGETGSGKSILLDAILFGLGHKFDIEVIRAGCESCVVSLEFDVLPQIQSILKGHAIECDDFLIIKRQQSLGGRKKFLINDQPVTQKLIDQISEHLVEIHGQNTHSSLLDASSHLKILDSYGDFDKARMELSGVFKLWQEYTTQLKEIQRERGIIDREIDYLQFVVDELVEMAIKPKEEEILAEKRGILQSQERGTKAIQDVLYAITSPDVAAQILLAQKIIYKQIKDDSFGEILSHLDQSLLSLEEARNLLEIRLRNLEPGNIDAIEERLFAIRAIARKHNVVPEELPNYLLEAKEKLAALKAKVDAETNLGQKINESQNKYQVLATELSSKRKIAALELEKRVALELGPLKMGGATLKIEFKERSIESALSTGLDEIRFVASTNPGTPVAPIDKIASGGELSRFMLAFKVALFDKFTKPTIIFDEIDTGLGGGVADAVGERLRLLGKAAQVISVTHQPQVAGKADHHISASKTQAGGVTLSIARILSRGESLEEIARMISGAEVTEASRVAAKELMRPS